MLSSTETGLYLNHLASTLSVPRRTVAAWVTSGRIQARTDESGRQWIPYSQLTDWPEVQAMCSAAWEAELATTPRRAYRSVELFAGAGGLALGLERAGLQHVLLNEVEADACATLLRNRPLWHVAQGDVRRLDFQGALAGGVQVDVVTGGFPCQTFSYAGKKAGFNDARGTLFYELARAVKILRPRVVLAENVKGLLSHDGGRTLSVIRSVLAEVGYRVAEPRVLRAVMYRVPQMRERCFLVAVREDLSDRSQFRWPSPYHRVLTLRDALCAGELYPCDVPPSPGATYSAAKREILRLVPEGGDWRDLPPELGQRYLGGSAGSEGGKTGMARRLAWDEPSLTLLCAPAQKQTERCHPSETRPLTVREYARLQTFPDEWVFEGSLAQQYRQIGNAVPVELAAAMGRALVRLLNELE